MLFLSGLSNEDWILRKEEYVYSNITKQIWGWFQEGKGTTPGDISHQPTLTDNLYITRNNLLQTPSTGELKLGRY